MSTTIAVKREAIGKIADGILLTAEGAAMFTETPDDDAKVAQAKEYREKIRPLFGAECGLSDTVEVPSDLHGELLEAANVGKFDWKTALAKWLPVILQILAA